MLWPSACAALCGILDILETTECKKILAAKVAHNWACAGDQTSDEDCVEVLGY